MGPKRLGRRTLWTGMLFFAAYIGFEANSALAGPNRTARGAPTGERRPSVLVVVIDDNDWAHYGFMGHPSAPTPTIDRLTEQGVTFPHAYAVAPLCRPTLAALLTGRAPWELGIYHNITEVVEDPTDAVALRLQAAGYRTFIGGKYWPAKDGVAPEVYGFDTWQDVGAPQDNQFVRRDQDGFFAFLDSLDGAPFYAFWAPKLPHRPWDPPEQYLDLIDPATIPPPPHPSTSDEAIRYIDAEYHFLANMRWFDDALAQALAAIRAAGYADDTYVLVFSDNGFANGYIGKFSPYDKGLRTPLIMKGPGIAPGVSLPGIVSLLDVPPTVLALAGLPIPDGYAGRSLLPYATGGPRPHDVLFGATWTKLAPHRPVSLWAVRDTDRLKLITFAQSVNSEHTYGWRHYFANIGNHPRWSEEWYDLRTDPTESAPLTHPRSPALRAQLFDWWYGGVARLPQDVDGDGFVDIGDLGRMLTWFGGNHPGWGDFDGDGSIGTLDLLTVLIGFGQTY